MFEAAFGGDGVEMFSKRRDFANDFHFVLAADFIADDRRRCEQALARLAEDFEQRAVIEFASNQWTEAV